MADPKTEFVPGEHYFTVICKHCGGPIPLLHDPTKGRVRLNFEDKTIPATCWTCEKPDDYPTSQITSTQLALSRPNG